MSFKVYFFTALLAVSFISAKSWGYVVYDNHELSDGKRFVYEGKTNHFWPYVKRNDSGSWKSRFSSLYGGSYSLESIVAEYKFDYRVESGKYCDDSIDDEDVAKPNEDFHPSNGTIRFSWYDQNQPWGDPFIHPTGALDPIVITTKRITVPHRPSTKTFCAVLNIKNVLVKFKRGNNYGHVVYDLTKTGKWINTKRWIVGTGTDREGERAVSYAMIHQEKKIPEIRIIGRIYYH